MNGAADPKWDRRFVLLAAHISGWSKDPSTQVGAAIVRPDHRIVQTGFNGFARGMRDDPALYNDRAVKYDRIIHGDMNALLFARQDVTDCIMYTYPMLPCARCFVHLIQAGIRRFVSIPASEDLLTRWADQLARVREYAAEVGAELVEIEVSGDGGNGPA